MKLLLFILILLFTIPLLAQEKALEMSKIGSEKTRIFKENKRVKVKTLDGEKYIGRFQIIGANIIEIDGNLIPLSAIGNIKSRSILTVITSAVIIITGFSILGFKILLKAITSITQRNPVVVGPAYVITGLTVMATGIFLHKFAKNYKDKNGWTYKIIEE